MELKKTIKQLKDLFVFTLYIIPLLIGFSCYFLSKILRALAYVIFLKQKSAAKEISNFWKIYASV